MVFLTALPKEPWDLLKQDLRYSAAAMPAKDVYHDTVKNALIKDGWTITQDPFIIRLTRKRLYVDLGAERLIAAQRDTEKIAVEVKSFTRASDVKDLEDALGQFVLYSHLLMRYEPQRKLYLAVSEAVYESVFEEEIGEVLLQDEVIQLVTFNADAEEIVRWVP